MGKLAGDRRHKRKTMHLRLEDYTTLAEGSEELESAGRSSETFSPSIACDLNFWPHLDAEQEFGVTNATDDTESLNFMDEIGLTSSTNSSSTVQEFSEIDFLPSPKSQMDLPSPDGGMTKLSAPYSSGSVSTTLPSKPIDSHGTKHLTIYIHDLSQKLSESPLALDEVLGASTFYLQSIDATISKLPDDPSRMSILLMIIICLTQILALFEECICPSTTTLQFDATTGPTLRLGNYQVDPDSQRRFRVHIVREHLVRLFNVAKNVLCALQQQSAVAGSQTQTYLTLVAGLQGRIKLLSHTVNNS
jgi:hypothetical protein